MHDSPTIRRITAFQEGLHPFLSGQQRSIVLTVCKGKPLSVSWLARPRGFVRSDVPCV